MVFLLILDFCCRDKFGNCAGRKTCKGKNGIKATAKDHFSSGSEPVKAKQSSYHPSEDIGEPELMENEEAQLKPAEFTRTIIEVKMMFLQNKLIHQTQCSFQLMCMASNCCLLISMI